MDDKKTPSLTLKAYLLYFLRLGALGFGGPVVLTAHMRRDLVDGRHWVTADEFDNGLALSQLAPGPLAAQLAIFLGWLRFGIMGANLVAIAFIAPSFLIVLGLSALYVKFSGLSWIQGAFYGIGAAVIAIMVLSVYKLLKRTIAADRFLWSVAILSAAVTAVTEQELLWIFLAAGILAVLVKVPPKKSRTVSAFVFPAWLVTGLGGQASGDELWRIFVFFRESRCLHLW